MAPTTAVEFRSEQGGNRIFAGISGEAPDLSAIELASGSAKLRVTGKTEIDEMPFFRSQEIAGGPPLIRAFATKRLATHDCQRPSGRHGLNRDRQAGDQAPRGLLYRVARA